jgi:predicted ATP-dependent serine protease
MFHEESQNKNEGRKNHLYQWQLLHPQKPKPKTSSQTKKIEPEIVIIDSIQTLHTDYINET